MSEPVLAVDEVTAGYNGVPAIRDLSFTLAEGEVLAILGPNGAGKTTTLLALAGMLPTMAGSITAFGKPIDVRRPYRNAQRGVQLVPDDRGLFFELTVREHFRLARGRAREQAVLEYFPALADLDQRQVGLLSGGEQQMLALAKTLISGPKVLMIDEMSLGLAPKVVQEILPAVRDLAVRDGIAVILVEQHVELALSVAHRGLVLNHGRVVLTGDAATLLRERTKVESAYFGADEFADEDAGVFGDTTIAS
jgi:branched-chain amino acid transport system ATP-binding protein